MKINLVTIISIFLMLHSGETIGQNKIEIGKAKYNQYIITADTTLLKKSMQIALGDGSIIERLQIESEGKFHYLVGTGTCKGYAKIMAVTLSYDIASRTWYAAKGNGYATCSSAACKDCKPFKENGQIIGCHCTDLGTVSNHCNFTKKETSLFYSTYARLNLQRNEILKK
ncbi:MAG: hypothetical protein ACK461_05900 [Bacteroidota bacterium]|nr:hypothetical protein [Sphingobacteriales bacterium]